MGLGSATVAFTATVIVTTAVTRRIRRTRTRRTRRTRRERKESHVILGLSLEVLRPRPMLRVGF